MSFAHSNNDEGVCQRETGADHTVSVWLSHTGVGSQIALPLSGLASASRLFHGGKLSASSTVVS